MKLDKEERGVLDALSAPSGHILGGFSLGVLLSLERRGLIETFPDPMFPSFAAYRITDAGRKALGSGTR